MTLWVEANATRLLGPPLKGWFLDRWLDVYYHDRVLVWIDVDWVSADQHSGIAAASSPLAQAPLRGGREARLLASAAASWARRLPHQLIGYRDTNDYPMVVPVEVGAADQSGIEIIAPATLPAGGRRAGLLAHRFGPRVVGVTVHQFTGWLEVAAPDGQARYAPHTHRRLRLPANKTLIMLLNGLIARVTGGNLRLVERQFAQIEPLERKLTATYSRALRPTSACIRVR